MYQNVAKHYSVRIEQQTFVILSHVKKCIIRERTLDLSIP
jgi:hypothetical protein